MTEHERLRDEEKLRRYLLGQCSPQESDEIEEAIVVEDDLADLVAVLESELAEDYVTGEMTEADRVCFERQVLNNEERLRKVRLSAMLLDRLDILENLRLEKIRRRQNTFQTERRSSVFGREGATDLGSGPDQRSSPSVNVATPGLAFYAFDHAYLDRLRSGDHETRTHFVAYFSKLIEMKLQSRLRTRQAIEDVRQETIARVFAALGSPGGILQPERLGRFVNSICNNVLLERYRAMSRDSSLEGEPEHDFPNPVVDVLGALGPKQMEGKLREILEELPERDRRLLRAVFLEERDKDEACREFGVDRDYLRILIHRAKLGFRSSYLKTRKRDRA